MNPSEYKKTKKIWESAAEFGKVILKFTGGEAGVIFLDDGSGVAAIVMGESLDGPKMIKTFKLFRSRLDDMIKHAENGTLHAAEGSQAFIRDHETGDYEKIE